MRAVIFATGYSSELLPLVCYRPAPLFRIVDKPILEHIIETIVSQGVTKIDLVISHLPKMLEEQIGDGQRWGVIIQYYLAKEGSHPLQAIQPSLMMRQEDYVIVGNGTELPEFSLAEAERIFLDNRKSTLILDFNKNWTGWGLISREYLLHLRTDTPLENFLQPIHTISHQFLRKRHLLSVQNLQALAKSNHKLISQIQPTFLFPSNSRMVEKGVWLSRGVTIHPNAKITPPVFIGEACQINAYAQIGPNSVIENNCLIDESSIVQHSLICQRSYVGQGLEVKNSIVDRNTIVNLSLGAYLSMQEEFILSELHAPSLTNYLLKSLGQYFAGLLIILFSPLFLYLFCTRTLEKIPVVLLPASHENFKRQTFALYFFKRKDEEIKWDFPKSFLASLPMLFNVVRGELHVTGVAPRSVEEVEQMPDDWRSLYLRSKVGLITLAMVEQGAQPDQDELYAAEAYYTACMSFGYDVKLFIRWLLKKLGVNKKKS